jgi:hypothetical protein
VTRGCPAKPATLLVAALLSLVASHPALAQDKPELAVDARYVFPKSALRGGVNEVVVRLENLTDEPASGRVLIGASMADSSAAESAYRLDAHASVFLHMPVQVSDAFSALVRVEKSGGIVSRIEVRMGTDRGIHVVDLAESTHLFALSGARLGPRGYGPGRPSPGSSVSKTDEIAVETPSVDAATGDLVLPMFATGWAGVDLAIISSDRLARLEGVELEALSAYVLGGGALAVNVTREEDLRGGSLAAFIGGTASRVNPRPEQLRPTSFHGSIPRWPSGNTPKMPGELTVFASYAGGNLEPASFGAVAQYGLGRVAVLGFDLGAAGVADDPWVQLRIVEILQASSVESVATPGEPVDGQDYLGGPSSARRLLNPERRGNWGVGLSALLLCIYAVIAGPVAFSRAKAKNRPLRALIWLPAFSIAMFLVIVVIGLVSRGSGSRARRMTFVDLGAGMDRGVGRRWRAILFPNSATFDAAPERRTSFLRRTWTDRSAGEPSTQIIDREGLFVKGVNVAPWETATLREEGIFSVGEGVSVGVNEVGDVSVRNRTGRTLKSVLVKLPDDTMRFFTDVAPDGSITAPVAAPGEKPWRRFTNYADTESQIQSVFADRDAIADGSFFAGLSSALGRDIEWLPMGVAVVLATFDEPSGSKSDTGAPLEWDRTLIRVVGVGGEP